MFKDLFYKHAEFIPFIKDIEELQHLNSRNSTNEITVPRESKSPNDLKYLFESG